MEWPPLSFEIIAVDDPLVWVEIRAFNGRYAATTSIWLVRSELDEFADGLAGFPATTDDERHFELGHHRDETHVSGHRWVPGYCSLHFDFGKPGGAGANLFFEDDDTDTTVSFRISTEAAAVDCLVSSLRNMTSRNIEELRGCRATLGRSF